MAGWQVAGSLGGLHRRVLTQNELLALNAVINPIWVYSCATNRILWGNNAAVAYFKLRSLEALQSFRFSKSTDDEHTALSLVHRVREEVEIGGSELVLQGTDGPLPGVLPHPDSLAMEVLYQQLMLAQPDCDTTLCTLVQLSRLPQLPARKSRLDLGQRSTVKVLRSGVSGDASETKNSRAVPLSMPAMLDLVEAILAGEPVCLGSVAALHEMLIRGEILVQSSRISQELLVKEELELDVGLNLLQLLSNSTASMLRDAGDAPGPGSSDGQPPPSATSSTTQAGAAGASRSRRASITGQVVLEGVDEEDASLASPSAMAALFPDMEAVLATVDDWRFDAFKLAEATQGHAMSALGFWLLKRSGLAESLQLDLPALARFLRKVESAMPVNPYHNATHAADVLQSMHVLMTRGALLRRLGDDTPLLLLAGYLAAIIHDNEHRGLNNDYLVRVSDDLALTYNDASPMENHHVAAAFRLMRAPAYNFLRKLSRERMVRLRRLLIEMVLATDMKLHFNILSKFQAKLQVKLRSNTYQSFPHEPAGLRSAGGSGEGVASDLVPLVEDEADRGLVMQVALKCADVGHLAAPWHVHHKWVSGLEEEFFRQGDREKAAHLNVSPLMDRNKDGITKSQVGFFDIVALPLFYSWAAVFQEALPLVRAVEDNCNRWRQLELGRSGHHGSK